MRSQAVFRTLLAFSLCVASPFAAGTAQRTFVSAIGTDNPNCSIAAPCRSFTAAMNATSTGGEIIVLESAGYGPVTITKSVSIIAPPGIYGGISVGSGLNGVTIDAPGATVVLRGLSINGQGGNYGILLQNAARVRVEKCVVSNMGVVGIYHTATNAEMIVTDTIVRDNTDGLGLVAADASILLDHVRSEHNTNVGFYIAPTSGSASASAGIFDSVFAYNGLDGIWADTVGGAVTNIDVERTAAFKNSGNGFRTTAGASSSTSRVALYRNTFSTNGENGVRVLQTFGQVNAEIGDNSFANNQFGTDIRADGAAQLSLKRNLGEYFNCVSGGGVVVTYKDNDIILITGCSITIAAPK